MFLDKMFFFTFVFLLIGSMTISIAQHEMAHKMFNDKFGLQSEYFFDLPWGVGVKTFGEESDALKVLHGMNEVISYNLTPYLVGIIGIIGMGFWFLGMKIDYWFEKLEQKGITIEAIPLKPKEEIILEGVDYI